MDRAPAVALTFLLAVAFAAPAFAADSDPLPDASASPSPSVVPSDSPSASPLPSESPSPLPSPSPSLSPSPSGGVDPSPSVPPGGGFVFDGVLGVIVLAGDGGQAIPGARVTVRAESGTGAAYAATAPTDSDGKVTFTSLPRPADPEESVLWVVNTSARVTVVDGECTTTTNYAGSTEVQASSMPKSVPLFAQEVTSIQLCGAEPSAGPGNGGGTGGRNSAATNRPRAGGGGIRGAASARPALTPPSTSTASPAGTADEPPVSVLMLVLVGASIVLLGGVARRRGPAQTALH